MKSNTGVRNTNIGEGTLMLALKAINTATVLAAAAARIAGEGSAQGLKHGMAAAAVLTKRVNVGD
jgi:hypothetical protein